MVHRHQQIAPDFPYRVYETGDLFRTFEIAGKQNDTAHRWVTKFFRFFRHEAGAMQVQHDGTQGWERVHSYRVAESRGDFKL
jgi:hypothetical protein